MRLFSPLRLSTWSNSLEAFACSFSSAAISFLDSCRSVRLSSHSADIRRSLSSSIFHVLFSSAVTCSVSARLADCISLILASRSLIPASFSEISERRVASCSLLFSSSFSVAMSLLRISAASASNSRSAASRSSKRRSSSALSARPSSREASASSFSATARARLSLSACDSLSSVSAACRTCASCSEASRSASSALAFSSSARSACRRAAWISLLRSRLAEDHSWASRRRCASTRPACS
mmetsp:Transcript_8807/g.21273  ORF Transcript_8807/g.21273 Transcript_8807/m.21273 type:complete len:239 (+) Transcript_8807:1300-2016(+)